MVAFIENPRRAPRIPVRCEARIALRSGSFFSSCTVDFGPRGCGVADAPDQLVAGERMFFEVEYAEERYLFTGRIAWASTAAPWRCGVAFDESSCGVAAALFSRIASAHPVERRGVERIQEDAILARTPVPGTLKAVPREAEILLAVGTGVEARVLRERFGEEWETRVNAVFALLERGEIEARTPAAAAAPELRPT